MGASPIDVCNEALLLLGIAAIQSFTEGTEVSKSCETAYFASRDTMLGLYPWPFATSTSALAPTVSSKRSLWSEVFQLPEDYFKIQSIELGTQHTASDIAYEVRENTIHSNQSEMVIKYTRLIPEVVFWDALFRQAVVLEIAIRLANKFTSDNNTLNILQIRQDNLLRDSYHATDSEASSVQLVKHRVTER